MPQSACILIADDDAEIRALVQTVLEKAGYRTAQVENGYQALQTCREQAVDLVVMDVMMPVMDGLEACRKIRRFSNVPVILLTVHADENALVNGFEAGALDYLAKPFRPRELLARIKVQLDHAPARQSPRAPNKLTYQSLVLDRRTHEVRVDGLVAPVSATSYQLLEYFLRRPGEVVSKTDLLRDVWAYSDPVGGRNMV
jgi:DNA-binding response OmpR family regulator